MVLRRETSYALSHHVGQSTSANRYTARKVSALPCLMSTFFPEPISVNCLYTEAKSCQTEIFLFLNLTLHTTWEHFDTNLAQGTKHYMAAEMKMAVVSVGSDGKYYEKTKVTL